jgi:hypothetical protein
MFQGVKQHETAFPQRETPANSLLESLYGRDCFTKLFHSTVSQNCFNGFINVSAS